MELKDNTSSARACRIRAISARTALYLALLVLGCSLGGCVSTNTASVNPLESKLLALEGQSLKLRADQLTAQRAEQARVASLSALDVNLPEPDLKEGSDVIAGPTLTAAQIRRNGAPIGKVSN